MASLLPIVALLLACGEGAGGTGTIDLLKALPEAHQRVEEACLWRAESQSPPPRADTSTQGEGGDQSDSRATMALARLELSFELLAARDTRLTLKGELRGLDPPEGVTVDVMLNGLPVGRFPVHPGPVSLAIPLAGDQLRRGGNLLGLSSGRSTPDRSRAPGPAPTLPVWSRAELSGCGAAGEPQPAGPEELFLPFGSALDYSLRLPPGSILAVDGLRVRGDTPGRLEVEVEPQGVEEPWFRRLSTKILAVGLPAAGGEARARRLSLIATPDSGGPHPQRGVMLVRPRVRFPVRSQQPAGL